MHLALLDGFVRVGVALVGWVIGVLRFGCSS